MNVPSRKVGYASEAKAAFVSKRLLSLISCDGSSFNFSIKEAILPQIKVLKLFGFLPSKGWGQCMPAKPALFSWFDATVTAVLLFTWIHTIMQLTIVTTTLVNPTAAAEHPLLRTFVLLPFIAMNLRAVTVLSIFSTKKGLFGELILHTDDVVLRCRNIPSEVNFKCNQHLRKIIMLNMLDEFLE